LTRKITLLLLPLLIVAAIELAFRLGVWEPLAEPHSHSGASVQLKRALLDTATPRIDFVTLGSSRPVYGIDHVVLAEQAQRKGYVHANLSMAGSHWMTVETLYQWLRKHRPEVRGGIIALSVQDMTYPGNGSYELGIVEPFRDHTQRQWIEEHVRFERSNLSSYGARYSLYAWRDDVRDFLMHPFKRLSQSLDRYDERARLFNNPDSSGEICALREINEDSCNQLLETGSTGVNLGRQCKQILSDLKQTADLGTLMKQSPLPLFMEKTRRLIQTQLREMHWEKRPIVVLMPMPQIWLRDQNAPGRHQWALSILQPLADEGAIRLIDATHFFSNDDDQGCGKFFDFYHQNSAGRTQFTAWLAPKIDNELAPPMKLGPHAE
jgi:hypothetical protein